MRRLFVLLCTAFLAVACSAPPQKEMDRAQGAIDAARAAGAEQYAVEPFGAATSALQQSNDAVAQRDYRTALSLALLASERAQEAAKAAADGKARARGEGERAAATLAEATRELAATLAAAEAARVPPRQLAGARTAAANATATLQEVRAMLGAGDYFEAREALAGRTEAIREQIRAVDAAVKARPAPPARRRR